MLIGMIGAAVKAAQTIAASKNNSTGSGSKSGSSTSSSAAKVTFDPNLDYAAAIANTTDPAERDRLLAQRQAKMDALDLRGTYTSNEDYMKSLNQPYWLGGLQDEVVSMNGLYDAAAASRLQSFEAARQSIQAQLQTQYSTIDTAYRDGMTQVEVNARRSALAGEEKLAALGLSMGGAYQAPTSGYAESSRIAVDNAYHAGVAGLSAAHLGAKAAAASDAANREASLTSGYYNNEAAADLARANATIAAVGAQRDYSLSVAGLTGFLNGTPTLQYQNMQAQQQNAYTQQQNNQAQMQAAAKQTAYEQAMARWKTYGYVLPADAVLLGVAAGTPTSDQSYRTAQLRMNQLKTNYQISR